MSRAVGPSLARTDASPSPSQGVGCRLTAGPAALPPDRLSRTGRDLFPYPDSTWRMTLKEPPSTLVSWRDHAMNSIWWFGGLCLADMPLANHHLTGFAGCSAAAG
jgi:hypothetical protein